MPRSADTPTRSIPSGASLRGRGIVNQPDAFTRAERHVPEAEGRVARQAVILE
jgi:hypothetical protein